MVEVPREIGAFSFGNQMNQQTAAASGANGQTHRQDLFVLTDEQILEIEPEAQDVTVREGASQGDRPATSVSGAANVTSDDDSRAANGPDTHNGNAGDQNAQSAQAGLPVPPAWLAETMNDPQRGADARALWEGAQRAEREAASFREVFAKPEEARAAAERARVLDDIDRAYFAGDASQRAQLAAMMMREDPAAFREMVFAGLRALEAAEQPGRTRSVASAVGATLGSPGGVDARASARQEGGALRDSGQASPAPTTQSNRGTQTGADSAQQAQLAAYAAFEKAANDDLEHSVGSAIDRTLTQALPTLASASGASGAGAQHAAPLQARLTAAIRQDVEKALQGDRQLGEQVAQILSGRRLDSETRAQVVRLIGERAQQLVPGAAKRALQDWTQTTLAAHRGKSAHGDTPSTRREVAPAAPLPRASQEHSAQRKGAARSSRSDERAPAKGRVNYGRLSDEQILDL
jgi:hypothetical protein